MGAHAAMGLAGLLLVGHAVTGHAQPARQDSARFTISGTSTVRAWSCPAQGLVKITPGASSPAVPGFPNGVQALTIAVPVRTIACEEKDMVEHLRETLNEKAHPEIVYQLGQYSAAAADVLKMRGTVTITGVTKPLELDVRLTATPQGVRATGETSIDMTSFNVTPPTLWLGALKVGPLVRVKFEATLQAAELGR